MTAETIVGQAGPTPSPTERELIIEVCRDKWVRYIGTAAQLTVEGLIPKDFEWPRAAADKHWEASGFDYWLRRTRPEGHKGPMRSWLELDNWTILVKVVGRNCDWHIQQELKRQAEELAAAYHRQSAAGLAEWRANWERYRAVLNDEAFRAFKEKIPGLIPPRRGRKPTATAQGTQR